MLPIILCRLLVGNKSHGTEVISDVTQEESFGFKRRSTYHNAYKVQSPLWSVSAELAKLPRLVQFFIANDGMKWLVHVIVYGKQIP